MRHFPCDCITIPEKNLSIIAGSKNNSNPAIMKASGMRQLAGPKQHNSSDSRILHTPFLAGGFLKLPQGEPKGECPLHGVAWPCEQREVGRMSRGPFQQKVPACTQTYHRHDSMRMNWFNRRAEREQRNTNSSCDSLLPLRPPVKICDFDNCRFNRFRRASITLRNSLHRNNFGGCKSDKNVAIIPTKNTVRRPMVETSLFLGRIISSMSLFESHRFCTK